MADCIVGVPTFGEVSIHFTMSLTTIAMPINFSNQFQIVMGKRIDEARNEIVEATLSNPSKPRFLFFLDDDVIMPPDALRKMIHRMENLPIDVAAISGVYYSKSEPGEPLIFQKQGCGSYYDWKVGDFFQAWAAGCGLVLIRSQALRDMIAQQGQPLFLIDYGLHKSGKGAYEARSITEDLYFYTKMGKTIASNGKPYSLWIDTSIQAMHYEKNSKKFFGLQPEEPQAQGRKPIEVTSKPKLCWVGCGGKKDDFFGCAVTRVDELKEFNPDAVAKPNSLPFEDGAFDIVYSAHLLHTFRTEEVLPVLSEWGRILKPGGKIWIKVPDIEEIIKKSSENYNQALDVLYANARTGFTKQIANETFKKAGFSDIFVFNNGQELQVIGRKGE